MHARPAAAALAASTALIVVCSPDAAESARVRKDVDAFMARDPRARIYAVIADNAPLLNSHGLDAAAQCFPPSFHGAALGGSGGLEPVMADARPGKGGWRDAWLTVAAGLAGADLQSLIERDHALRRARSVQRLLVAPILVAALVLAGAWTWAWHMQRRSDALVDLAHRASAEGRHDRAMRYALAALDGAGAPIFAFDARPASAELDRAAASNRLRGQIGAADAAIVSAAFDPGGARILTVSTDGAARVWDARRFRLIRLFRSDSGPIHSAAFAADGARISTVAFADIPGAGGAYREAHETWDAATGRRAPAAAGANLAYDSRRIPAFYDTGWTHWTETLDQSRTRAVDYNTSAHGDFSAAIVWDVGTGHVISTLQHHKARAGDLYRDESFAISAATFSPDGRLVATAATDGVVRLWDSASGIELLRFATSASYDSQGAETELQFSGDGKTLLTQARDGVVHLWSAAAGRSVRAWTVGDAIASLSARDADVVAVAPSGVQIFRDDGRLAAAIVVPDRPRSAVLSDDATRLLTWSAGAAIVQVWDASEWPPGQSPPGESPSGDAADASLFARPPIGTGALDPTALRAHVCADILSPGGLTSFSAAELVAAPELDPVAERDACQHPPLRRLLARAPAIVLGAARFHLARFRLAR